MATLVYVARRPCGCVVAAMVDDTGELVVDVKERRQAISDCLRIWIRAGWRVDSIAAEQVPAQWFTTCPHQARQPQFAEMTVTNPVTGEIVRMQRP
jgi:hypothetical protein